MEIPHNVIPCQICIRECVERGLEKYHGGHGEEKCSECGRRVCPVHFFPLTHKPDRKDLCRDCRLGIWKK